MLRSSLRISFPTSSSSRRLYAAQAILLANDNVSSSSAGSSNQQHLPPPEMNNSENEHVSDREWELRTGRAMDILQRTLPAFFSTGLVATNYHLPLHMHKILGASHKGKERARLDEQDCETCNEEGIYARTVRLEYTPPVALPAPLPRMLKVEGLPLYVASSVFVRHGMHALYTDLDVTIRKVEIHSRGQQQHPVSSTATPAPSTSPVKNRERSMSIAMLVSGLGRLGLSKERAEWDVSTTYTFSPGTGRIILHTVNAIHPAPSETVYAAFQSVLSSLNSGFGSGAKGAGAVNVNAGKPPR